MNKLLSLALLAMCIICIMVSTTTHAFVLPTAAQGATSLMNADGLTTANSLTALAKPGMVTYLQPEKLSTFATNAVRMLFRQIEGQPLGNLSEGNTQISNQRLTNLNLGGLVVKTDTVNNKPVLSIRINNLSATYNAHIAHRIKILFVRKTFKMNATVTIAGVNMQIAINPYINTNKAFAFNTVSSYVNIGNFKIKISSSNILVKIMSVFTSLFKRKIQSAINTKINSGLQTGVQSLAAKSSTSIPSAIKIGAQQLSLAIQDVALSPKYIRTAFDLGLVGATSTIPRETFDLTEPTTMFGVTLGVHVINQLIDLKLKKTNALHSKFVAATDRAKLPTLAWDFTDARYPVTLQQKYGSAYTASAHTTWNGMKFTATPGVLQFVGDFETKVIAQNKASGAFGDVVSHHKCSITQQTSLSIVAKSGQDYIKFSLPKLAITCTTIVGDKILTDLYIGTLNYLATNICLPIINAVFAEGIQIPKAAGMSLASPQFNIKQNAIAVGTSFTINL